MEILLSTEERIANDMKAVKAELTQTPLQNVKLQEEEILDILGYSAKLFNMQTKVDNL